MQADYRTHVHAFFPFFLTHNRGGPSPQGGLIPENEYI